MMGRLAPGKTLISEIWMEIKGRDITPEMWDLVKQTPETAVETGNKGKPKDRFFISFLGDQDTHERVLVFRDYPKMTSAEVRLLMDEREERGDKGRGR